jgi:hypothetical protein
VAARKTRYRKLEYSFTARMRGRRSPRVRCRCSHCEHRETFRGLPWLKKRVPQCPECGSRAWRVDWYRQLTETSRNRCDCGGRHFPHRRGSCGIPIYQQAAKAA